MLRFGLRVRKHFQQCLRTQHNISPHIHTGVSSVTCARHGASSVANESGSVIRSYRSGISDGIWEDEIAVSCRDQDEKCSGNSSAMQNERIEGQQSAICNPCASDKDLHADINNVSVKVRDLASSAITDNLMLSAKSGTINFSEGHKCITTSSTTKDVGNCSLNNSNPGHGEEISKGSTKDDIPGFFAQNKRISGASPSAEASISQGQGQLQFSGSNQGDGSDNHDNEQLVPPDPETCCGSGCVNCVYIKYVQEVLERDPNDRRKVKDILDQIEDYNVKMFIKMELEL